MTVELNGRRAAQSPLQEVHDRLTELLSDDKDEDSVVVLCRREATIDMLGAVFESWVRTEIRTRARRARKRAEDEARNISNGWQQEAEETAKESAVAWRDRRKRQQEDIDRIVEEKVAPVIAKFRFTQRLLASPFRIKGEGEVIWGEATLMQHNTYLGQLDRHINKCEETYELHEAAAKIIAQYGVGCLNEAPREALGL